MTVAEYIAKLQSLPQHLTVCSQDRDGDFWVAREPYVGQANVLTYDGKGVRVSPTEEVVIL